MDKSCPVSVILRGDERELGEGDCARSENGFSARFAWTRETVLYAQPHCCAFVFLVHSEQ